MFRCNLLITGEGGASLQMPRRFRRRGKKSENRDRARGKLTGTGRTNSRCKYFRSITLRTLPEKGQKTICIDLLGSGTASSFSDYGLDDRGGSSGVVVQPAHPHPAVRCRIAGHRFRPRLSRTFQLFGSFFPYLLPECRIISNFGAFGPPGKFLKFLSSSLFLCRIFFP